MPQQDYDAERYGAVTQQLLPFLRGQRGLSAVVLTTTGALGVRDDGQIRGEYRLTEADVRQGRRFDDAICRADWPIEYWDPERGVSLDWLPPGHFYEIPARALKVAGFDNLWSAGKCLSAEPLAQASARVAGTCWAMGEAVGRLALQQPTARAQAPRSAPMSDLSVE